MPKRDATSELTDRNWDLDDEPEEAGTFQVAASREIEKRVIKKAKRRVNEGGSESAFSGFKGFGGFGAKSTTTPTSSLFNLGSSKPNGGDNKPIGSASFGFAPKPQTSEVPMFKVSGNSTTSGTLDQARVSSNGKNSVDYTTQLRSLNICVLAWIKKHLDENPVCDLSPIFEDYKKHLADIEKNITKSEKSEVKILESVDSPQKTTSEPAKPQTTFTGGFSFKPTASESNPSSGGFQLGSSKVTNSSTGLFKPVSNVIGQPAASGFSFGKIKPDSNPLSFGGAVAKDEDEYQPPKVEVKEIKEKDSLFTIRCKLFYKSDDSYKDKGVGNLHLKKTGAVAQLIIRADTNLGNIILNIALPPNIPLQRQGKNNVMMVIPPNPPLSNKCPQCNKKYVNPQGSNVCESGCKAQPVPLLFRVKTAEDADKLLEEIKTIMK